MRWPPPIDDAMTPGLPAPDGLVVGGGMAVEPLPGVPPEFPVVLAVVVSPVDPLVLGALPPARVPAPDIEFEGARTPVTSILWPACAVKSWAPGSRM